MRLFVKCKTMRRVMIQKSTSFSNNFLFYFYFRKKRVIRKKLINSRYLIKNKIILLFFHSFRLLSIFFSIDKNNVIWQKHKWANKLHDSMSALFVNLLKSCECSHIYWKYDINVKFISFVKKEHSLLKHILFEWTCSIYYLLSGVLLGRLKSNNFLEIYVSYQLFVFIFYKHSSKITVICNLSLPFFDLKNHLCTYLIFQEFSEFWSGIILKILMNTGNQYNCILWELELRIW